jgi:hypothetical protein
MNSFNPSKYSSVSSEVSENSIDVSSEIVEKGHKNILKVDIGKFDELCKKFKEKKDVKIKKLFGEDKENFDLMVNYVHLLYGTSHYSHLFEKVRKHFKGVTSVKPGTVGGYFAGCLVNKKLGDMTPGCSLGCAGSMPLPKDEEGWSFCDKAVIMAERGINGYVFSVVKPAESDEDYDPAYVFVESNTEFEGFSKSEKANLKAIGCKNVKLIGYSDDMSYSELYKDSRSVEDIKNRRDKSDSTGKVVSVSRSKESYENNDSNTALIVAIIVFVILLLIFLYLAYRYYKLRN